MENLIGKSFKALVKTGENGNKTIEILPNLKGEEMKRTNFREMNKKLNELKVKEREASFAYLISESGTLKCEEAALMMDIVRNELEQFRNTKISEGI